MRDFNSLNTFYVATIGGLLLFAGCGSAPEATVVGKVTLDSAIIENGTITFVSIDHKPEISAWNIVEKGRYMIPASAGMISGKYRVEIRALQDVNGAKPAQIDTTVPVMAKELIPEKFNSKSKLVVEITAGENTSDFLLKTK